MLSVNGYNFTLVKKVQRGNCIKGNWRCTIKATKRRPGCKCRAITYETDGVTEAIFKGSHYHLPQISSNHRNDDDY